jgi:hypothetical protein
MPRISTLREKGEGEKRREGEEEGREGREKKEDSEEGRALTIIPL